MDYRQPAPTGVKRSHAVIYVAVALFVGVIIGGVTGRWMDKDAITLGRCVPIYGMQCLDAMNKK